ncbi:MAG: SRPBCC family protein [Dehalococcoidia bacterium]|nr:SRPBCC family protein [Dehalococcoidia bacterium]
MRWFSETQRLPVSLDEAWSFFSSPANLAAITPPDMGFQVLGEAPEVMRPGLLVRYRVRPLLGIPVTWVTEITRVEDGRLFVDEQRSGPYAFWQHQHRFREVADEAGRGVEMRDIVHYEVGFGLFGDLVDQLVVRRRLAAIFAYRRRVLEQRFGTMPVAGADG